MFTSGKGCEWVIGSVGKIAGLLCSQWIEHYNIMDEQSVIK